MPSLPDDIMKNRAHVFSTTILLLVAAAAAPAQEKPQGPPPAQGRGNMGRPIVLGPDDVRAFPDAPAGFNTRRAGVPAGRIEPFEYDSARHQHAAQGERLSAARLLERQEVPRALPAARHRRRRDGMDPLRARRTPSSTT